jgi:hypothetical protein
MINLKNLERKLDDALSKESPETLTSFINEKRQKMENVDDDDFKNKIQSQILYAMYDKMENIVTPETVLRVKGKVSHQVYNRIYGQVYFQTKNQVRDQVIRKIKL